MNEDETSHNNCNPLKSPCLFNIREDPCERINLASSRPMVLLSLENALVKYKKGIKKPQNLPSDENADPRKWNNTWVPWQDCEDVQRKHVGKSNLTPVGIAVLVTLCTLFLIVIISLIVISAKTKGKKANSKPDMFTEETMDAPTSVVHVKTNDVTKQNESFEDSEHVRQNSIRNGPKSID